MIKNALDIFGEILMRKVRDKAIIQWDKTLEGKMKDSDSQLIYKNLSAFTSEQVNIVSKLIPRIIDTTLHHFLWTLEQERLIDLTVKVDADKVDSIKDISDGLAGELYTEDGWIMRFSMERYEEPNQK